MVRFKSQEEGQGHHDSIFAQVVEQATLNTSEASLHYLLERR